MPVRTVTELIDSGPEDLIHNPATRSLAECAPSCLGISDATSQCGPLAWLPPARLRAEDDSVGWPPAMAPGHCDGFQPGAF